ncbi:DUF4331 family protein [Nonomuraea typhae]|uniref:DUF4331 family protein n=1 Tax=Nonomuraea typhae TaxID=2603600 RepID=UPI0012F7FA8B|nr:DUF4331 family protein [Nonomuraea typhae]
MSDHLDAPGLKPPHGDARIDITDIYAFQKPDDATRSVLVMCVNPLAPTMGERFHPGAAYNLHLDTDGDAVADRTFTVTFSDEDAQAATVRLDEQVLFEGVPACFGREAQVATSGEYTFFAGIRSDAFFFDLEGFKAGMAFTGADFFADKNVFAIVVEVPNTLFGRRPVGYWTTVVLDGKQVERMARPLMNIVFTADADKNAYNGGAPANDRRDYTGKVVATLLAAGGGYSEHEVAEVAGRLLPDLLRYDCTSTAGYPNGRQFADDIVDEQLAVLTKGNAPSQGVKPHSDTTTTFPYLGVPH